MAKNYSTAAPTFPPFPIAARVASHKAATCGLTVTVETFPYHGDGEYLVWRGTEAQFRATGILKSTDTVPVRQRRLYPGVLRGYLCREGADRFMFAITWCYVADRPTTQARQARDDLDYQRFRNALLTAPDVLGIEAE